MIVFKPEPIEFVLSDFETNAQDYFSEAHSINSRGSLIVGTIGKVKDKTVSKKAGIYHGFTRTATFGGAVIERLDYANADATSVATTDRT